MEASRVTQKLTEDVQRAAYFLYLDRTKLGTPGTKDGDWFEAERILRPRQEDVRREAWFIFLRRKWGHRPGDALQDWLDAETTLIAQGHHGHRDWHLVAVA